jgi:hypothetical protein
MMLLLFSEAIIQVVKCDNQLFLSRQEKKGNLYNLQPMVSPSPLPLNNGFHDTRPDDPMQVDATQIKGPLSYEERERRKRERFCFYYGGKDHKLPNCPKKPIKYRVRETNLNTYPKNLDVQSQ